MVRRLYPAFVSLLGGLGLGLALTYFVGIYFVFHPEMEEWAEFFEAYLVVLLLPPYVLLVVHLVLRNHVGLFLLRRGAFEAAVDYARPRAKASLLRSRREAATQRLVWIRGLIAQGEYEEARDLLMERLKFSSGKEKLQIRRWLLEIALRLDELESVEEFLGIDEDIGAKSSGRFYAALKACEAEIAIRVGDLKRYEEFAMAAIWADGSHPRGMFSRALAMVKFEDEEEAGDEVLRMLQMVEEPLGAEIPPRRAEIQALRAKVLWRRGRTDESRELLQEAQSGPSDRWADQVVGEVKKAIDNVENGQSS